MENLYKGGKMSEAEYNVYCEWFKMITQNMDTKVDLIGKIYVFSHNFMLVFF